MSNDLISRAALLKEMEKGIIIEDQPSEYQRYRNIVKNMPAAYDTDKAAEQIEKTTRPGQPEYYLDGRPVIYKEQAIEIIRSGGRQQDE